MNVLVATKLIDREELSAFLVDSGFFKAAGIWLVHVEEVDKGFIGYDTGPKYIRDEVAEKLKKAHHSLHQMSVELEESGLTVHPIMVEGEVVASILDETKRRSSDVVVLGSRNVGMLHDALVGNTVSRLIKELPVPLVLVPIKTAKA